jgi:hypothetical protein
VSSDGAEIIADDQAYQPGVPLSDPHHVRGDCRDIITILKFGNTFTAEQIQDLIQRARMMAIRASDRGEERAYSACMRVILECAKVQQRETPIEVNHTGIPETMEVVVTHRSQIPLLEEVARNVGGTTSTG